MVVVGVVAALIAGLVFLYLTRPNYEEFELSSARFFQDSSPKNESSIQFSLKSLLLSRAFYLQLAVLVILLLALLLTQCSRVVASEQEGIGVWLLLDTSNSMTTEQDGRTRWDAALEEVSELQGHLGNLDAGTALCFRVSTFDSEIRDVADDATAAHLRDTVDSFEPRSLGTDIGQLRRVFTESQQADTQVENERCAISHIVVISDLPAPDWTADEAKEVPIIWRDVGSPVANVGITEIQGGGWSLTGAAEGVDVEVTAYHSAPDALRLSVTDGAGTVIEDILLTMQQPGVQRVSFTPARSGLYTIQVEPGGSYIGDDTAIIAVDIDQQIRVDWQHSDNSLLDLLRWQQDEGDPHVRVMGIHASNFLTALDGKVPVLLVGDGYVRNGEGAEIDYFDDDSLLLADLSLDVLESLPAQGIDLPEDSPLQHVLYDMNDRVWLAEGRQSLAAYIPGLPVGIPVSSGDDNLDAVSATIFFNAVSYLLQERQPVPLYTLTDPENLEPEGNRTTLHAGEGNTAQSPLNRGEIADIQPVAATGDEEPIWPMLLALAVVAFLLERFLSSYGGVRWR